MASQIPPHEEPYPQVADLPRYCDDPSSSALGNDNSLDQTSNVFEKHLADGLADFTSHGHVLNRAPLIDGQLLEAVSSAGAQLRNDVAAQELPVSASLDKQSRMAEEAVSLLSPMMNAGKRKRPVEDDEDDDNATIQSDDRESTVDLVEAIEHSNKKRSKHKQNQKPVKKSQRSDVWSDTIVLEQPCPPSQPTPPPAMPEEEPQDQTVFVTEYPTPSALSDARAAGVYSAAALFRKPSATTKKYTRPPMSKLFSDLELTPENFLHLQAQAKAYMLDEEHPDRRACVGNRGKGDTDMTKLKLFHCVREFLEPDLGVLYFGPNSDGADVRKWSWPTDVNKVIAAVTPLLRRMVTNERQRQYANESRRGGGRKKAHANERVVEEEEDEAEAAADEAESSFDPTLSFGVEATVVPADQQQTSDALLLQVIILIRNATSGQQQVVARFDCPANTYATFSSWRAYFQTAIPMAEPRPEMSFKSPTPDTTTIILAHGHSGAAEPDIAPRNGTLEEVTSMFAFVPSTGLKQIESDDDWAAAIGEAKSTIWMEQELRIVVEVVRPG